MDVGGTTFHRDLSRLRTVARGTVASPPTACVMTRLFLLCLTELSFPFPADWVITGHEDGFLQAASAATGDAAWKGLLSHDLSRDSFSSPSQCQLIADLFSHLMSTARCCYRVVLRSQIEWRVTSLLFSRPGHRSLLEPAYP